MIIPIILIPIHCIFNPPWAAQGSGAPPPRRLPASRGHPRSLGVSSFGIVEVFKQLIMCNNVVVIVSLYDYWFIWLTSIICFFRNFPSLMCRFLSWVSYSFHRLVTCSIKKWVWKLHLALQLQTPSATVFGVVFLGSKHLLRGYLEHQGWYILDDEAHLDDPTEFVLRILWPKLPRRGIKREIFMEYGGDTQEGYVYK